MTTHRIRLHGFWTVTDLGGGRVRYARQFGRPRALHPGETAWLVGARTAGAGAVRLNGEELGAVAADESFAFDVTARLRPRNEVWIDAAAAGGDVGAVVMEIRGDRPA